MLRFTTIPKDAFSKVSSTECPTEGNSFLNVEGGSFYKYKNGKWRKEHLSSCPNCGAPYEGKERCEYCGTYLG